MIKDIILAGIESGWKTKDASRLTEDLTLEADVVIVGSGAGGGTTAEILARAGLSVVLLEEGPLKSSSDFKMREPEAYASLYQESAARQTKDKGIGIFQGRSVGGSTTVNWTSSFRTPPLTLAHWEKEHGLKGFSVEDMAPWFAMMERRLNIARWAAAPNANNDALRKGAEKLGFEVGVMRRNVNGCWNLGYCGMGCPTNAKQSMLITTIPAALSLGATLVSRVRAERLIINKGRVDALECSALDATGTRPGPHKVTVKAKHYVISGGAIGSPALLLRSGAPDPHKRTGKRTFLHPVSVSLAVMPEPVNADAGAPQSIYSDHFLHTQAIDGPIGYKLEVAPLHPAFLSTMLFGHGKPQAEAMSHFANMQSMIALLRDGFNEQSQGGTVTLKKDGSPLLDYPISDFVWDGVRRSLMTMVELQFAAGAKSVRPLHENATSYENVSAAKAAIAALPMEILKARVVSAHVMGGCAIGPDEKTSVVNFDGRHHQVENLSVFDGSLFPTSIGANPQLSIYGLTSRLASALAEKLTGKPAHAIA